MNRHVFVMDYLLGKREQVAGLLVFGLWLVYCLDLFTLLIGVIDTSRSNCVFPGHLLCCYLAKITVVLCSIKLRVGS